MSDYLKHILPEHELSAYLNKDSFPLKAMALLRHQMASWDLAKKNFALFDKVEQKELILSGGSRFFVQHNPERIRSAAAKVDEKSLAERPCFLCADHLPKEQKGLVLLDRYLLLVNPFPIFKTHFTIPTFQHSEQRYEGKVLDFLRITEELQGLTVLYNGAKCGASAPDHFHFQAFGDFDLPVFEYATEMIKPGVHLGQDPFAFIKLMSDDLQKMESCLLDCLDKLPIIGDEDEPRINLLCRMNDGQWELILIPRTKHRASSYFKEGKNQILVSPGAVDFSIFIAPRKEDFDKLNADSVNDILKEVTENHKKLKALL